MAPLGPKRTSLIQASRRALRPTAADRERIEDALRARLGAEALAPDTETPADPGTPLVQRAAGQAVAKTVVAAVVAGGALFLATGPRPSNTRTPPAVSRSSESAAVQPVRGATDAASEPRMEAYVAPVDAPTPRASSQPTHPQRTAGLAREVRLLSRATSALKAGRTADALRALDAHQRQFPSGILTEERRAAKGQALCLLGRFRDGRAELSHLALQSPAAVRAAEVCDEAAQPKAASRPE